MSPELREQLKSATWTKYSEDNPSLTLTEIRNYFTDVLKDYKPKLTGIKHYLWEEDGVHYSMWDIHGLWTGDAGYEAYLKALNDYEES